ncbi:AzlC family ABC transporter permease [Anaerovorax sp. IOR16]|uniref:AzlC family ABC transporter permease n=1 Tax=Anaerovorax sp. IOR16 TaxID=2773458 RepID=UPI0019D094C3|nr:AzlC family ABC transporter permease [Anaerovorax sp. IOR16]
MKKAIKAAFPHTIPILLGYLSIGIPFGLLLENAGYNALWAFFMSLVIFSGSMQYLAVGMMATGLGLVEVAMMSFLVNVRYMFYGLSFIERFSKMGWKKYYMIFALTDETYSLLCSVKAPKGVDEDKFILCIAALNHSYWIVGSIIGALAGSLITFNSAGMDFAMTALFLVIFLDQWRDYPTHIPALLGIAATLLALFIFGGENLALPAMLFILILLFIGRTPIQKRLVFQPLQDEKETIQMEQEVS